MPACLALTRDHEPWPGGEWRLAPAYDLTYNYHPKSRWVSGHQMSVAGKFADISIDDMIAASKVAGIKEVEAGKIIGEVREAVARWREFAETANVAVSR